MESVDVAMEGGQGICAIRFSHSFNRGSGGKDENLEEIRRIIGGHQEILMERYGVRVAGLFGSYVRGEQQPGSDVDLLADFVRPASLLELVGAELYLSEVLGMKVDLIPKRAVREELRETIFRETIAVRNVMFPLALRMLCACGTIWDEKSGAAISLYVER